MCCIGTCRSYNFRDLFQHHIDTLYRYSGNIVTGSFPLDEAFPHNTSTLALSAGKVFPYAQRVISPFASSLRTYGLPYINIVRCLLFTLSSFIKSP